METGTISKNSKYERRMLKIKGDNFLFVLFEKGETLDGWVARVATY